ncbi:MAG: hypothetical protein JWO60_3241, partial [Frankiales bacterium]|nr:hypothetical protein [Frankiales bacterium]
MTAPATAPAVPLRAADLRFLLPDWPARVAVLGLPDLVADALRA